MLENSTGLQPDTPLPSARYDRRTKAFRQVRNAMAAMVEEAGGTNGLTPAQMQRIERGAQLKVLAAEARARALRDPTPENLNAAVRVENAAERALKTVAGLASPNQAPRLKDYLAEKRGAA
jgi:hypothetical protein